MWHIYIMKSYSAIKGSETLSFAGRWMELEIMLCKMKPDNARQISHAFSHVPCLSIFNKWEMKVRNSLRERSNIKWERNRKWQREKIDNYHALLFESSKPCPISSLIFGLGVHRWRCALSAPCPRLRLAGHACHSGLSLWSHKPKKLFFPISHFWFGILPLQQKELIPWYLCSLTFLWAIISV